MRISRVVACLLAGHKSLTRHRRGTLSPNNLSLALQRCTGTYMRSCKVLLTDAVICAVTYQQSHSTDKLSASSLLPTWCPSASSLMIYRYEQSMYSTYSARTKIHNATRLDQGPLLRSQYLCHNGDNKDGGDGKTCLPSTNDAAPAPVESSAVSCLSSVPSFPSNNTSSGKPDAWWQNVTLSHHITISLHDRGRAVGIYMTEEPCRIPAGDQLCFPYRHRAAMRLAQSVGTNPFRSGSHPRRRVTISVHSCCIEDPSHTGHPSAFPWESTSGAVHAPFGPTILYVCDVSRDLEGRDLVKRPTLCF